jgi:CMP-N,N'-diacetyllegionaminic acid synthase
LKFISVIPARAGSKGVKNKNIFPLNKKPLISYTFNAAKKSMIKNNFVLTDSKKIKKIAKNYGINGDYERPKKFSQSNTSLIETLSHFYEWTKKKIINFDYMVVLQPTSPLRKHEDINRACNLIKKNKCKSLFSISESLEHPYEAIDVKKGKWKYILKKSKNFYRRQDFDINSYFINGSIYIIHKNLIIKKKIYEMKNHKMMIMPKSRSLEINDLEDINIIKPLIKSFKI